ncbi:MAG: 3-oxoacyl-ACP reductase FabG [Gammaproteobacteria bacterium]|jgi:3-oxoacyl-[acyl-carrier protein] reductase|nr:3-oxoacyl-ACP reductase FabG [Gammaproteobacteria bacterium]MDH3819480.1 3-oxoacyl-ACP reductase FabG [Gammaproteobacteria bacterium]
MHDNILVTGASSGIGRAIAVRLAAEGYTIAAHFGKNEKGAIETLDAIRAKGSDGRLLSFDISDAETTRVAIEDDMEQHGAYYGVVCNAGITRDGAFPMLEQEDWRQVIDVNLNGLYNVLHPIVMPMIRRRMPGRIVTISSVSGIMGNRGQVNYSASKAGIIGATKSLAVELAKRKITVNCVAPGLIESDMTEDLPIKEMLEAVPMRRMGKAEEVAAAVAFLCSPDAAYITRQVLSPNGGMF